MLRSLPGYESRGGYVESVNRATALLTSSVGRKIVMALTGIGLVGFLIAHLLGNLYIFQGREALNAYAAWLKAHPLLWPARIGLLAIFVLHAWLGIALAWQNRRARPIGYERPLSEPMAVRYVSRRMLSTGLVVLAFVVYHLAHFSFGAVQPDAYDQTDARGRHDVYAMVVDGFRNPWVMTSYVVAMLLLGLHLAHAGQSVVQTLGVRYGKANQLLKGLGLALAAALVVGNVFLPILVAIGLAGPEQIERPVHSAGVEESLP